MAERSGETARRRGGGPGAASSVDGLLARRFGPFSGRVWGLVLNLAANAVTLWGVSSLIRAGSGWGWIVVGGAGTAICVALLARPDMALSVADAEEAGQDGSES